MVDRDYTFGDYTFGLQSVATEHDNRFDYRLSARAKAIIRFEVDEPSLHGEPQQSYTCPVRELSASGLRLWSVKALPVGALMPAVIHLTDGQPDYQLMLEIVWCEQAPDSDDNAASNRGFMAGCRVLESDGTETVEWLEAVAAAMLKA